MRKRLLFLSGRTFRPAILRVRAPALGRPRRVPHENEVQEAVPPFRSHLDRWRPGGEFPARVGQEKGGIDRHTALCLWLFEGSTPRWTFAGSVRPKPQTLP